MLLTATGSFHFPCCRRSSSRHVRAAALSVNRESCARRSSSVGSRTSAATSPEGSASGRKIRDWLVVRLPVESLKRDKEQPSDSEKERNVEQGSQPLWISESKRGHVLGYAPTARPRRTDAALSGNPTPWEEDERRKDGNPCRRLPAFLHVGLTLSDPAGFPLSDCGRRSLTGTLGRSRRSSRRSAYRFAP